MNPYIEEPIQKSYRRWCVWLRSGAHEPIEICPEGVEAYL